MSHKGAYYKIYLFVQSWAGDNDELLILNRLGWTQTELNLLLNPRQLQFCVDFLTPTSEITYPHREYNT